MSDISTTKCKLIGISCIDGKERDRVIQAWNSRFHEHEAFWVNAQENQTAETIAQSITAMMRSHGIVSMSEQTVVCAVFLDLIKKPNLELIREIVRVPSVMSSALGCMASFTLEFGFLGEVAFCNKMAVKEHIQDVVDINLQNQAVRTQLCLVATSPLVRIEDDCSWKAAMICLDVLRRDAAPSSLVHFDGENPNNNIGFIRYGEFDKQKLQTLKEEQARLIAALGNGGETALRTAIDMAMGHIETNVANNYPVEGNSHPVHPKMFIESKGIKAVFEKKAAQRGDEPFRSARNSTWNALDATGKHMRNTILASYREQIDHAADYLQQFIQEAGVGIELKSNTKLMTAILEPKPIGVSEPLTPDLAYKENGYVTEISGYLETMRRYAAAKSRRDFAVALLNAYNSIDPSVYVKERATLNQELNNVNIRLSGVISKQDFQDLLTTGGQLPQSSFHPQRPGGNSSCWALCRESADYDALAKGCTGLATTAYYIDSRYGGLKALDNAPMKAVQLLQFQCSDERLNDLIG